MTTPKAACGFTFKQFLANAIVRAILTAVGAGFIAAAAPLIPVLGTGTMPDKALIITALAFGAGGTLSALVSLISRFLGDPNSGSFVD